MAKRKAKNVYFTPEPDWIKIKSITDTTLREKAYQDVQYFVRTEVADKKKIQICRDWIKTNSGWASDEINTILKCPDWAFGATASVFFIFKKVGYIPQSTLDHVEKRKFEWITQGEKVIVEKAAKAEKAPKKVISIQERMKEQVTDLCGDFEYFLDQLAERKTAIKDFDPYKAMQIHIPEIKGPHAKIIKNEFDMGYNEAKEVLAWEDEDLKEAYSNFDIKMRKAFVQYYELINTACDTIIQTKATTRKARAPKARSKEKIVSKLKCQINDSTLGIASAPLSDVVYANEVWVYNTKTRKIGVYKATNIDPKNLQRPGTGIMVKGTTLIDFNEKESVQKTLRKPPEQIKDFVNTGKLKCKKSFETIKTTATKMNGRFNDNTIILQTF